MSDRASAFVLKAASLELSSVGIQTARLDAEILLAHVLKCDRLALFSRDIELTDEQALDFKHCLTRRLRFEPVSYITGMQPFWSLDFKVNEHVLIPRPDTETLIEAVLKQRPQKPALQILDLGTGSGCILLSLLAELGDARGVGADMAGEAIKVAQENAVLNGLAERASFVQSDWFSNIKRPAAGFDIIVSNPPYIMSDDIAGLMPDVKDFEPKTALDGGMDGLGPYRVIILEATKFLSKGGLLAVEFGIGQAGDIAALFEQAGYFEITTYPDLNGIDRVISGKNT
ncbi:peptide chain release factor N(5)-glutamine methyltransferase [Kordiimonas pumila]|uniref:Release factor glutamine methyltransferase n=1 Tax=Kordiimonas pumila TaxID=2161677 RepID=A0ABV7D0F8_9PROT|nr:peptide chain release factor N(5)-glutamine methyltransferase [Kordiimonas pumila]